MKTNIFQTVKKRELAIIIVTLIIGLTIGGIFFGSTKESNEIHNHTESESDKETLYTCSMHPQIKQNEPGDCPICGMDLVPVSNFNSDSKDSDPNEIQMTESAMKLAEIQTVTVKKASPEKSIHLFGKVKADERNKAQLTARFGGRIEKLYINYTGQNVSKGQKLGTIYSPDLITAQRELLEAIKYKENNPSFYKATRSKLKLWDLSDKQIMEIEQEGEPKLYFDILSPISGTITKREIALGDYIKEGKVLFEVIDLTNIWIMFDAYESDLPWIKTGDKINFTLQSVPGKKFSSKLTYIDPFINARTRVAQLRVEMKNPDLLLKPEMFANGILISTFAKNSKELLIPKSSILWTGKHAVVYVKTPNRKIPSFVYREILLGPESGSYYVVAEGLSEGEEIATNGVFKIDASAQLAGKPSMMNPEGGKTSSGHNHGETKMNKEEMSEMDKDEKIVSKSFSKNVSPSFKKQVSSFVEAYLKMKDSFVKSDEKIVENDAKNVLSSLSKIDMTLLKGDAHNHWMKLHKTLEDNLNGIINMKGIEMKRSHFSIVSDKLTETIEKFGINSESSVYLEFCPMAFDNKGAFWISNSKEIRNPYFGDMMLKCGEVKKEFNK